MNKRRWWFLDKWGWPIERIRGRWLTNILRTLLHTRRIIFAKQGKNGLPDLPRYHWQDDGTGPTMGPAP